MHEQATHGYTVGTPQVAEEVAIYAGEGIAYVIRREPHPDHAAGDDFPRWIVSAIRERASLNPWGHDVTTREAVDYLDGYDERPVDVIAREWAEAHNLDRWAS